MARATFWVLLLNGLLIAALLLLPRLLHAPFLGQAIGAAVLLYNILLPLAAWLRNQHELLDAWLFLMPLSLFLVVPDWILAQVLGVLVFPDLGGARIGPVPAYLAGLWVAPLLLVVWLAEIVHRQSAWLALLAAAAFSLALFAAVEWLARPYGLWAPRGVGLVHGVALYALPAELLLGLATWLMFVRVQGPVAVRQGGWRRRGFGVLHRRSDRCVLRRRAAALINGVRGD